MFDIRTKVLKTSLDFLYTSNAYRIMAPFWAGRGLIFMLHHIRPKLDAPHNSRFHPNRILEVTPEFLANTINKVRHSGFDLVSLDQAVERLKQPNTRPFVAFTIDDGYLDNYQHALPVFERMQCPFTVFVTPKIIDGTSELWWLAIERIIAENAYVQCEIDGEIKSFQTISDVDKENAYREIYWAVRLMEQKAQRVFIRQFADAYGLDLDAMCRQEAMNWDQVRELHAHPMASIGAHTLNHYALSQLSEADAVNEITGSRDRIAEEIGDKPEFFCYPYGDPGSAGAREFALTKDAGFKAAVTTRKGVLYDNHVSHLAALPRVSLNGDYQALKYVELYLSGAPFALWNKFRKLNVA